MSELTKENVFTALSNLEVEKSKKWKFDYSSWSDVWSELKKHVPDANFEWIENKEWTLGLVDDYWCFAKVRVFSEKLWVDVTQYLHAMDFSNKAIQKSSLTAWEINKTYQRCMVKAIAVWFWLGLYIYKWEDFPDESDWSNKNVTKEEKPAQSPAPAQGKCTKCGASMKLKADGLGSYCSALCWKNPKQASTTVTPKTHEQEIWELPF